jgi:mannose-6-phosphate isomerase-like protein (cupin superfamily)
LAPVPADDPPLGNSFLNMVESTFLSGKVLKRTLPVLRDPAGAGALAVKRLLLSQGEVAQFYDADEPVRYIAFIELREGGVRGNHYHKMKEEFIYLIQGEVQLVVEDDASKSRETVQLAAGDLAILQPGVAHALRTLRPGQALEFSKLRFDPNDTYRHPLI